MSQRNSPLCRPFRHIDLARVHAVSVNTPASASAGASAPGTPDPALRIGVGSHAPSLTLPSAASLQLPRNTEWVAYRWMATIFAFLVCFSFASAPSPFHPAPVGSGSGSGNSHSPSVRHGQVQQGQQHEPTELASYGTGCQCVVQITGGFNGVNGSRGERGPPGGFDPRVPIAGAAPLVLVGAGAGSGGATVAIDGTDMAGTVTVRTGSTLGNKEAGKPVFTLAFGQSYPHRPSFVMLQASSQSAQAIPVPVLQDRDADGFTALGASLSRNTVYSWIYLVHL